MTRAILLSMYHICPDLHCSTSRCGCCLRWQLCWSACSSWICNSTVCVSLQCRWPCKRQLLTVHLLQASGRCTRCWSSSRRRWAATSWAATTPTSSLAPRPAPARSAPLMKRPVTLHVRSMFLSNHAGETHPASLLLVRPLLVVAAGGRHYISSAALNKAKGTGLPHCIWQYIWALIMGSARAQGQCGGCGGGHRPRRAGGPGRGGRARALRGAPAAAAVHRLPRGEPSVVWALQHAPGTMPITIHLAARSASRSSRSSDPAWALPSCHSVQILSMCVPACAACINVQALWPTVPSCTPLSHWDCTVFSGGSYSASLSQLNLHGAGTWAAANLSAVLMCAQNFADMVAAKAVQQKRKAAERKEGKAKKAKESFKF